jgi:hypothetical protein
MNNWSQTARLRGIFLSCGGILSLLILAFSDSEKAMIAMGITTTIAGFIGVVDKGEIPPEKLIKSLEKVDLMVSFDDVEPAIRASKKPDAGRR